MAGKTRSSSRKAARATKPASKPAPTKPAKVPKPKTARAHGAPRSTSDAGSKPRRASSRPRTGATAALLREIALSLPDAVETITWGEPHFRVAGKIFGGVGRHEGREVTSAKLEKTHAEALLLDPRFSPAPYVGRYGWVQFALEDVTPAELRALVEESYRLVAPKKRRA